MRAGLSPSFRNISQKWQKGAELQERLWSPRGGSFPGWTPGPEKRAKLQKEAAQEHYQSNAATRPGPRNSNPSSSRSTYGLVSTVLGLQQLRCFPALPAGQRLPFPTLGPGAALPLSYVGGIVEQEWEASSSTVSDEVSGEFVVEWHQIRERDWLLHDALVPEQWDWH